MTDGAHVTPGDMTADLDATCLLNLLGSATELIYFKDRDSRFLRVSQGQADRLAAGDMNAVLGQSDASFHDDAHARKSREDEIRIMETGEPMIGVEERATYPSGDEHYVETTKQPLWSANGQIIGTFGISRDITERKKLMAELSLRTRDMVAAQRDLLSLLESSPDAMTRYDLELRYVYANPAAIDLMGGHLDDVLRRTDRELGHSSDFLEQWEPALRRVLKTLRGVEIELRVGKPTLRFLAARMVPEVAEDGTATGIFVIARDHTERNRAEEALAALAVSDPLTGLANRLLLTERIGQALGRLERQPGRLGVVFLDLDRFKAVNDRLGHAAGDAVLVEVARRLRTAARRSDTVGRIGGDEFVMLCDRLPAAEDGAAVVARIRKLLDEPVLHEGHVIHIAGSIGIAVTEDPHASPTGLLRSADASMYRAKNIVQRGRDSDVTHRVMVDDQAHEPAAGHGRRALLAHQVGDRQELAADPLL